MKIVSNLTGYKTRKYRENWNLRFCVFYNILIFGKFQANL